VEAADQIPGESPGDLEDRHDKAVLALLCGSLCAWSVEEIARELGSEVDALDAVGRLRAAGLVHCCGEFVFPTRAARRADELNIGSV
jgi:hypothetical protein